MGTFLKFAKLYGVGTDCRVVDPATIQKYKTRLPTPLLNHWQEVGWCAFGGGLIWVIDPGQLEDVLGDWLGSNHGAIPFCRSAFANIFMWHESTVKCLHTQFGEVTEITDSVDSFFNFLLCRDWFVDDMLHRKLFKRAMRKLGPLGWDDCYTFEPALSLGGSGKIDTVGKGKIREYLAILSQLVRK